MKKNVNSLRALGLSLLLGAAAATAALTPSSVIAPAEESVEDVQVEYAQASSVTPANYSCFVAKTEYVKNIDIMFDDATEITVNEGVLPIAGLGNAYGAMPTASQMSYYFAEGGIVVSAIEGGVRISLSPKATYGGEEGFTYSAATNGLNVIIPEGMVTVKGIDGVERPNAVMALRYIFENFAKPAIENFADGETVTPDMIADIVFPEGIVMGQNPSAATGSIKLYQPGASETAAWTQPTIDGALAGFTAALNEADNKVHATFRGDVFNIPAGDYRIVVGTSMTFKNSEGKDQKAQWSYSFTLKEMPKSSIQLVLDRDQKLYGPSLPTFLAYTSGTISAVPGKCATATVGDETYNLILSDGGKLNFSEEDAAAISAKYLNKMPFDITIAANDNTFVIKKNGNTTSNRATSATFSMHLCSAADVDEVCGEYYSKYFEIDTAEGHNAIHAHNVTIAVNEEESDDETVVLSVGNLLGEGTQFTALLDSERRILRVQPAMIDDDEAPYLITNQKSPMGEITGYILDNGSIEFSDIAYFDMTDYDFIATGGEACIVKDDGVTPDAPVLAIDYNVEKNSIVAIVTLPENGTKDGEAAALSTLTALRLSDGVVTFKVEPATTIEVTIDENPESGATYSLTATAENCARISAASNVAEYTYSPLVAEEVAGDYYIDNISGNHKGLQMGFTKTPVIPSLKTGNYTFDATDCTLETVGEAANGKVDVKLSGLFDGIDMLGVLDLNLKQIEITIGENNEYTFIYDKEDNSEMGFLIVAGNGTSTKPKPVIATIDNNVITFPAFAFSTVVSEGSYTALLTCKGGKLLLNRHKAPAAPVVEMSCEPNDVTLNVSGTVTLSDGSELDPHTDGYNSIYVYRVDNNEIMPIAEGPELAGMQLIHSATKLQHGASTTFTDNVEAETSSYIIVAANLNTYCEEPVVMVMESSAVDKIVTDALSNGVDVYDLNGRKVLDKADSSCLRNLAPGIYVASGMKILVTK